VNLHLEGKVAIVGGASRGIGYGIARTLAGEGATVAITARREPALREAADRIRSETGSKVLAIASDVRKAEDTRRVIEETVDTFGGLNILVNNDGAPPLGKTTDFDDDAWDKAVERNLMSVVRMTRAAAPHMRAVGGGSIVNMAALSALQPVASYGLSVTTWAGVIGLAKTLSLELGGDGITVNTVCPGRIGTARLVKVMGEEGRAPEEVLAELARDVPLGRLGTPEDVAGLVAFLVSKPGSYITGATIQIDGGLLSGLL
jgi:3-oxoacyl-[acyl-carrier protein] reductase